MALDRVRSLAALIRSARRAQHSASRREGFDDAKRYKDKAMEAEVWLQQTVRDASVRHRGNGACSFCLPPKSCTRKKGRRDRNKEAEVFLVLQNGTYVIID